jgi:TATA-box binding protein (TBP) (component of TFIID and TFIIIB)
MEQPDYKTIALDAFNKIKSHFANLKIIEELSDNNVDLSFNIPKQQGLDFDINLNLQTDELHMSTEFFSGSWFPIKHPEVISLFIDAVKGLITGDYRILQYWNGNKLLKSYLQKPADKDWKTICKANNSITFPWTNLTELIIRNTSYKRDKNFSV